MTAPPSTLQLIHAYRSLLRTALHAVQFSKPARYVVKSRLRAAFRDRTPEQFNAVRVARTLQFLQGAVGRKGLEHVLLKRLMHVWWERGKVMRSFA